VRALCGADGQQGRKGDDEGPFVVARIGRVAFAWLHTTSVRLLDQSPGAAGSYHALRQDHPTPSIDRTRFRKVAQRSHGALANSATNAVGRPQRSCGARQRLLARFGRLHKPGCVPNGLGTRGTNW
jgi:hypothetical protein